MVSIIVKMTADSLLSDKREPRDNALIAEPSFVAENRGSVAHVHPTTVIGKSSRLAHTLKIDWLHDISTSCTQCRSYKVCAAFVGAASCRDQAMLSRAG